MMINLHVQNFSKPNTTEMQRTLKHRELSIFLFCLKPTLAIASLEMFAEERVLLVGLKKKMCWEKDSSYI